MSIFNNFDLKNTAKNKFKSKVSDVVTRTAKKRFQDTISTAKGYARRGFDTVKNKVIDLGNGIKNAQAKKLIGSSLSKVSQLAGLKPQVDDFIVKTKFVRDYNDISRNISLHKSFDLSNIGVYNSGETDEKDKYLRQFHQMRIFVSGFNGMRGHGSFGGGSTYLLSSNLPESFNYSIGSKWEAPFAQFATPGFNAFMQVASKATGGFIPPSGINRAATLKIWGGSEPLKLTLKIPVIDDGHFNIAGATGVNTNVQEALEFLGSLALPSTNSQYGFYNPPPSPLRFSVKYGSGKEQSLYFSSTYGRIAVQLGGIMLLDHCIIEGFDVEYPNTKTMIRHHYDRSLRLGESGTDYLAPLLANVTITISTLEAVTSGSFSKMLWLKQDLGIGAGSSDVSFAGDFVSDMYNSMFGGK